MTITNHNIEELLFEIKDPEIPVLSIMDMGIVRNIEVQEKNVYLKITPTYSGCPAMDTIATDIKIHLDKLGYTTKVELVLAPAWTTDWIQESSKQKLREYGIAPPDRKACMHTAINAQPEWPHCGSVDTKMVSEFGSTACKAHFQCNACLEPFDYFKCI